MTFPCPGFPRTDCVQEMQPPTPPCQWALFQGLFKCISPLYILIVFFLVGGWRGPSKLLALKDSVITSEKHLLLLKGFNLIMATESCQRPSFYWLFVFV